MPSFLNLKLETTLWVTLSPHCTLLYFLLLVAGSALEIEEFGSLLVICLLIQLVHKVEGNKATLLHNFYQSSFFHIWHFSIFSFVFFHQCHFPHSIFFFLISKCFFMWFQLSDLSTPQIMLFAFKINSFISVILKYLLIRIFNLSDS